MRTVYATLGLVFVLLMLNFGNGVNSDAWFLLNHGRYVASFGIPHVEPFTLHEGFHFVMQQWLFAWLLWQIYAHAGSWGLVAFSWAAGAAILFAYCRLQILVSAGNRKLACLLTGLRAAELLRTGSSDKRALWEVNTEQAYQETQEAAE